MSKLKGGIRTWQTLLDLIHNEQLLKETDGDEKGLCNLPLHIGNPMLRHGDTLDLAVHRAAMVRELISNTRLACLLASQEEQKKLFATRCCSCHAETFFSTKGGYSHGSTCSATSEQEKKEAALLAPTAFEENDTRYGKLPRNSWSSETEERRLFWNMTIFDG